MIDIGFMFFDRFDILDCVIAFAVGTYFGMQAAIWKFNRHFEKCLVEIEFKTDNSGNVYATVNGNRVDVHKGDTNEICISETI